MRTRFLSLLLAFLAAFPILGSTLLAPTASAQLEFGGTIEALVIQGNQRFSDASLIEISGLSLGDPFDEDTLNEALKRLIASDQIEDAEFARTGNTLLIRVEEPNFINQILFDGNERLGDERLLALIGSQPTDPISNDQIQSDVNQILAAYAAQGRLQAQVRPYISDLGQGRVDLVFEIYEGSIARVGSVNFVGNAGFASRTLRGVVSTKQYNAVRNLTGADRFTELTIARDVQALEMFYRDRGYLDFQVTAAQGALVSDQSGFVVTFALAEGPFYRLGNIQIVSEIDQLDSSRIRRPSAVRSGVAYSASQVETARTRVLERAEDLGFGAAQVRVDLDRRPEDGRVDLTFVILDGPALQVERIEIEGNLRTRDYVIRREMRLAEGDAFSRPRLLRSLQRIQGLRFFSDVTLTPLPGSSPQQAVILVDVQEASTGSLNFGGGISTGGESTLNLSYVENNFLGRGQRLSLNGDFASGSSNYSLAFNEPWLLGREVSGGFRIFDSAAEANNAGYTQQERGLTLTLGYKTAERWQQNWTLSNQTSEVSDVTSTSPIILDQEGTTTQSSLATRLRFDDIDNAFDPSSGLVFSASTEVAGGPLGGDVEWTSARLQATYFHPLSENLVLRLAGSAGQINSNNDDPVPLVDRYIQSSSFVRGFDASGIGPRTQGTDESIGATTFYGASAELRFPIPGLRDFGLSGRVFMDTGTAYDAGETFSLDYGSGATAIDDSDNLRLSTGVGLTWQSPIGPLLFDWGKAQEYEDFDRLRDFTFNFGVGL